MPESAGHKSLKNKDAGRSGKTEVKLPSGKRLDAVTSSGTGVEIERGGAAGIKKSVGSLKEAVKTGVAKNARIRVPQPDMPKAVEEMKKQRVSGQVTNLSGTRKVNVPKAKNKK